MCLVIVLVNQGYHLSYITKNLESIFSVVQHHFSSCCIPVLSHSMNIWTDTHDF